MSTIKVDTYLTRGGASEIAIDKLKGVTAAGSMLVVGEGGTNTTNLQQGLAKAWINMDGSGTVGISDSFNVSGISDDGTGQYQLQIAMDMAATVTKLDRQNQDLMKEIDRLNEEIQLLELQIKK